MFDDTPTPSIWLGAMLTLTSGLIVEQGDARSGHGAGLGPVAR
jgi:hypothetical protein